MKIAAALIAVFAFAYSAFGQIQTKEEVINKNAGQAARNKEALDSWNTAMRNLQSQSAKDQKAKEAAEQARLKTASAGDAASAAARQNQVKVEEGSFRENMRMQEWYDRAFAEVPSVENFSNAYVAKIVGQF